MKKIFLTIVVILFLILFFVVYYCVFIASKKVNDNAVYIKKKIVQGKDCVSGDFAVYVIWENRVYMQSNAEVSGEAEKLQNNFCVEVDGKEVLSNSYVGGKLYSVKGYKKENRIMWVQNAEVVMILDCCEDIYISTLQDILDMFHYERTEDMIGELLQEAESSRCYEFDIEDDPCKKYDDAVIHTINQEDGLISFLRIYPNGYIRIPIVRNSYKVIYFKINESIMDRYPEFFGEGKDE